MGHRLSKILFALIILCGLSHTVNAAGSGLSYDPRTASLNAGIINKVTVTAPATGATISLANGSTFATAGSNSLTLTTSGETNVTLPTTGTLQTLAGTESVTNHIFDSTNKLRNVTFQDPTTTTKQAQFAFSGITPGQTRTYTFPNITSTIAVLGLSQTFSATQAFNQGLTSNGVGASFQSGGLSLGERDDTTTTGSNVELDNTSTNDYAQIVLKNASLTSIKGLKLGNSSVIVLINNTGNSITIKNNASVSALCSQIITGTGADIVVPNNCSITLTFNVDTQKLNIISGTHQRPISTDISGLGSGVATFLGTPSSSNLASALTDETGTGSAVLAGSPTLTGTVSMANATYSGLVTESTETQTASFTVSKQTTYVDASGGNITITLPAESSMTGIPLHFIRTDSSGNTVTFSRNVNGSSLSMTAQYDSFGIISNGTSYFRRY